jgi:hypothetical protein
MVMIYLLIFAALCLLFLLPHLREYLIKLFRLELHTAWALHILTDLCRAIYVVYMCVTDLCDD